MTIPNVTTGELIAEAWGDQVADAINAMIPTAWTNAGTLGSGWLNYGSGYQTTQYRKVGDEVQIRGLIKSGTTNQWATLFTLPVGFRPPSNTQMPGSGPSSTFTNLEVATDGAFKIFTSANSAQTINCAFSITP